MTFGSSEGYLRAVTRYPKIELHVHLEGTVRAQTLRQIAQENDYALRPGWASRSAW